MNMIDVIVPLAGPDFISPLGKIKGLTPILGQPLLRHALDSRPWASQVSSYTFVLKDTDESRSFAHVFLRNWYPRCRIVFLTETARGAACSVLAGLAIQQSLNTPIVIDLADILYSSNVEVCDVFLRHPDCGALALVFESTNPSYSYLRTDMHDRVIEAAEKRVISKFASVGTYIFRDCPTYLRSLAYVFDFEATHSHNSLFYVCPLLNGVLSRGMEVRMVTAANVLDIKIHF